MAYTCPTCGGTGKVVLRTCPTCLGNKTLVESSHRTAISWRSISLGKLVGVRYSSPTVAIEDVTGLNSPTWIYTDGASKQTHVGMIRQLTSGDITPGTLEIEWIGIGALADNFVGCTGPLVFAQLFGIGVSPVTKTWQAMLLRHGTTRGVGELLRGSASFQLLEV